VFDEVMRESPRACIFPPPCPAQDAKQDRNPSFLVPPILKLFLNGIPRTVVVRMGWGTDFYLYGHFFSGTLFELVGGREG